MDRETQTKSLRLNAETGAHPIASDAIYHPQTEGQAYVRGFTPVGVSERLNVDRTYLECMATELFRIRAMPEGSHKQALLSEWDARLAEIGAESVPD